MNYSTQMVMPLQQTSPRLMTPPRPLGTPSSLLKCFSNKSRMPESLPSVQILDMTYHNESCVHWTTSQIQGVFRMNSMISTANIIVTILISPHLKFFGPLHGKNENITSILQEVQHMPTLQQMMTLFPSSTQLWPTLLLNMSMTMLV